MNAASIQAQSRRLLLLACALMYFAWMWNSVAIAQTESDSITVTVGVRVDAKPFSYNIASSASETVLAGYGGYVIELCRSVLHEMRSMDAFRNMKVKTQVVSARDRFDRLENGNIDLLCGPDSITPALLKRFDVSHPIFLSGMTYGYINPKSSKFPKSNYCRNVIGVVRKTTADLYGLSEIEKSDLLIRFDEALELDLENTPSRHRLVAAAYVKNVKILNCFDNEIVDKMELNELKKYIRKRQSQTHKESLRKLMDKDHEIINGKIAKNIITKECPLGFTNLPIRKYENHNKGIKEFCNGKVLYYLGDFDIISNKIDEISGCDVELNRFTRSKEVYGLFFPRKKRAIEVNRFSHDFDKKCCEIESSNTCEEARPVPFQVVLGAESENAVKNGQFGKVGIISNAGSRESRLDRALFYTTFNNILFSKFQGKISEVESLVTRAFGKARMSNDLAEFFGSFKISEFEE